MLSVVDSFISSQWDEDEKMDTGKKDGLLIVYTLSGMLYCMMSFMGLLV